MSVTVMTMDRQRIHEAFRVGDIKTLRAILGSEFPRTNVPDEFAPPLEYAIHHSPLLFIRELVDLGASPNFASDEGFPSIIAALTSHREEKYEVIDFLISVGADINQRGLNDWTPLHYAAMQNDVQAIELLISRGADPNSRTRIDDCATPLDEAERVGHGEAAQALRAAISRRRTVVAERR